MSLFVNKYKYNYNYNEFKYFCLYITQIEIGTLAYYYNDMKIIII